MSLVARRDAVATVVEGTGWPGRLGARGVQGVWAWDWTGLRTRPATAPRSAHKPPAAAANFNASLHGARGALAFLVFLFHVGCSGMQGFDVQQEPAARAVLASMQFGVELFFCISGYIIVGALQRARSPGDFFLQRTIRILPVLWLTLLVVVPLGLLTNQPQFAALHGRDLAWILPVNLAALAGVLPVPVLHMGAWSLSYEFLFYGVAALMWWIPAPRTVLRSTVAVLAMGLVILYPRALFFVVGMLVARIRFDRLGGRFAALRRLVKAPGLVLAGFMACWYAVQFGYGGSSREATVLEWGGDARIGIAAAALGLAALGFAGMVEGHGILGRVLRSALVQWLGTCSYSFYLWHLIVIAAAKRAVAMSGVAGHAGPWSQAVLLLLCLPISLLVAHISFQVVELRFGRWLKQKASFLRGRPAALTVPAPMGVLPQAALPA